MTTAAEVSCPPCYRVAGLLREVITGSVDHSEGIMIVLLFDSWIQPSNTYNALILHASFQGGSIMLTKRCAKIALRARAILTVRERRKPKTKTHAAVGIDC